LSVRAEERAHRMERRRVVESCRGWAYEKPVHCVEKLS